MITKSDIENLEIELGLAKMRLCTNEEIKELTQLIEEKRTLPVNFRRTLEYDREKFYYYVSPELSNEDINKYINYNNNLRLKTIQNTMMYIAAVLTIPLAVAAFYFIANRL